MQLQSKHAEDSKTADAKEAALNQQLEAMRDEVQQLRRDREELQGSLNLPNATISQRDSDI